MERVSRPEVLLALRAAVDSLSGKLDLSLVPERGFNIAYAVPAPRSQEDVAAIQGGIVCKDGSLSMTGPVKFGTGEEAARVVLTASHFDPDILSAAIVRFSPGYIQASEDLFFEICSYDRTRQPPGASVMDWGVASCCRTGVPDIIYDTGPEGQEPVIRLLDISPGDVTKKVIMLQTRILKDI